jgi:membrane protein implicated in regulation of membrane protease activity
MSTVFLFCAALGGGVLVLQLVLSMIGLADHDLGGGHHGGDAGEALNLLSVRSLSAGLAFFGLTGMALQALAVPAALALPVALLAGAISAVAVAYAMRLMLRMEEDGTFDLQRVVGASGSVYLSIPGGRVRPGKVHVTVDGHHLELPAVSEHALDTGASVMVIEVHGSEVVEVVPSPVLGGMVDVPR